MPDPETQELQTDQVKRVVEEKRRAEAAEEPAETKAHQRRAERAAYLKRKLDERAESEDEQ